MLLLVWNGFERFEPSMAGGVGAVESENLAFTDLAQFTFTVHVASAPAQPLPLQPANDEPGDDEAVR